MGKKIKTLDGVIPNDLFEKLLLESQQVATVVLMLDSPEDEVVIRAGCALFQFSEKCDENKVALLDLNAIDKLVRLLQNDERKIRRAASMTIGSMSQQVGVRKALRKREETIPLLIRLLFWEEDDVVQEYVTLCLSSLAVDYSCKSSLCRYGAMEPLIQCVQSGDVDVQKNSIQTIALMLQDYPSRASLREVNGFEPIFDLLKSDYPVIQYHALVSLQLAAEDDENRSLLSELKVARILMDYLQRSDTNELHVFAIMTLVNCFENHRIMQDFRDYGGFQRLLQFITEVQANPEEERKGKKEKTSSKTASGKKARADDEDEKQKSKGATHPVISIMPDIKEQVARVFAVAAEIPENLKMLHEQDKERKLMSLLGGDRTPALQTAVVLALGSMSSYKVIRDTIVEHDGLDILAKLGKSDNADLLEAICFAYANITKLNPAIYSEMFKKGIVDQLLSMITKPREMTVVYAAMALGSMATDESSRSELIGRRIVPALVELLRSKSCLIQVKSLVALTSFLIDPEAERQIVEANCIELLLSMFDSFDESVTQSVSWLIFVISANKAIAADICNKGGLNILRQIQCSASRRNPFSELALQKLFDSHLSAKYAFTGCLDSDNMIFDRFYDPGRLREIDQLKTVEEYGSEPINDQRPIILVNPKPAVAAVQAPPVQDVPEVVEKPSKTGLGTGNPTKATRDAKGKRSQKEKEKDDKEKQKELELQNQIRQQLLQQQQSKSDANNAVKDPYTIPGDNSLLQYITEVQDQIAVLPDMKEQIKALARFVSNQMGGVLDYENPAIRDLALAQSRLKTELKSNVIPIGMIKTGLHYHRALLFKVLSDRIGIPCSLVRGDYSRAWNVVMISEEILLVDRLSKQLRPYVVDLIRQPGELLKLDSCEAITYQRLIT